jgi:hypothetical protein
MLSTEVEERVEVEDLTDADEEEDDDDEEEEEERLDSEPTEEREGEGDGNSDDGVKLETGVCGTDSLRFGPDGLAEDDETENTLSRLTEEREELEAMISELLMTLMTGAAEADAECDEAGEKLERVATDESRHEISESLDEFNDDELLP